MVGSKAIDFYALSCGSFRKQARNLIETAHRKSQYVTTVRLAVHKYLKKAGISKGAVHTLRHTFGTYKSLNGVPPKILQGIMGHKKLESTLLYVHLVDSEVRAYQRNTPL